MLSSNNSPWNANQKRKNSSQEEQTHWDFDKQGDAIYDYERVPASWHGFDDQSNSSCDDIVVEVKKADHN